MSYVEENAKRPIKKSSFAHQVVTGSDGRKIKQEMKDADHDEVLLLDDD